MVREFQGYILFPQDPCQIQKASMSQHHALAITPTPLYYAVFSCGRDAHFTFSFYFIPA